MATFKTADKLQKYAYKMTGAANTIWAQSTNSAYFNFQGTTVRISDHLPTAGKVNGSGVALSIITTSNPDQYILQRHSTGKLSVLNYKQAKDVIRSIKYVSDVFRYPQTPFRLEREIMVDIKADKTIMGVPVESFTPGQLKHIRMMATTAQQNRQKKITELKHKEEITEHLKV